jgi:hypothetical protein
MRRANKTAFALLLVALFNGCWFGKNKPETAGVLVFAGCGDFPPGVQDCLEALPPGATDLAVNRCLQKDRTNYKAEVAKLHAQFAACAFKPK